MLSTIIFNILQRLRRTVNGSGIGRLPGVEAVYNALFTRVKPNKITCIPVLKYKMYVDPSSGGLHPHLLQEGIYEYEITDLIKNQVQLGQIFVDIGANIGYHSILAADRVGDLGRVIAFEPCAYNTTLFKKNLECNSLAHRVTLIPKGVGEKNGTLTLYIDETNHGNHSIAVENIVSKQDEEIIEIVTLDSTYEDLHLPTIDWIKIDTQGSEEFIMKGSRQILQKHGPSLIIEFWPKGLAQAGSSAKDLLQILREYGYMFNCIDYPGLVKNSTNIENIIEETLNYKGENGAINLLASIS